MSIKLPHDAKGILKRDERILWSGRPAFIPYTARNLVKGILVLIFMLFFIGFSLSIPLAQIPLLFSLVIIIFFIGIPLLIGLSSILYPLLVWKNIWYIITDKRIIVRRGVIGIDYDFLSLEYIQEINIERGFFDMKYNTGTLVIQAVGVSSISLSAVKDPFKLQDLISKAVKNYKTSEL